MRLVVKLDGFGGDIGRGVGPDDRLPVVLLDPEALGLHRPDLLLARGLTLLLDQLAQVVQQLAGPLALRLALGADLFQQMRGNLFQET